MLQLYATVKKLEHKEKLRFIPDQKIIPPLLISPDFWVDQHQPL